jgi:hypothetical protein
VPGDGTEDPNDNAGRDDQPPDDYSGNRHTTATLTSPLDLAQREKAKDQTQDWPDDAKPPEQ